MKDLENILEVRVGNDVYGFDADAIEQILVVPPITPIPLSDESVLGVAVLSGKIVYAIDLGILIGSNAVVLKDESARLLTLADSSSAEAFVVDEVIGMIEVDEKNFEENGESDSFLQGFYKTDDKVVQLLSIEALLKSITVEHFLPVTLHTLQEIHEEQPVKSLERADDEYRRGLFFKAGDEHFVIDIEALRELIFAPSEISPIAGSDAMGMITLRDEVVTLLDMNILLGFEPTQIDEKSRALIAYHDGKAIGLLVDEVEEVKNLQSSAIEPMPEGIASEIIGEIYKEEERIASIISSDFIRKLVRQYHIEDTQKNSQMQNEVVEDDVSEIAVFKIGNEEYAFDIEEVQEIIRYDTITPVPEAPAYMEGILNLRGAVIPIISLPHRLGFDSVVDEKTKIIVCSIGEEKIGFIVDDVSEILFVEDRFISKATSEEALFDEVINLNDGQRVILKIRAEKLLDEEMIEQIKLASK